jgi:hypothetical protein
MTAYTFSQLFDFTRTTAGTFVGSNGLIQNTPASVNLLTFTQEFDNAAWVKTASGVASTPTVTANSGIAPDGTATADRVQFALNGGTTTTDRALLAQSVTIVTSSPYTFSVWLRSLSGSFSMGIGCDNVAGNTPITVTSEWQRFTLSGTASGTAGLAWLQLRGGLTPTQSNAADILIWGAQLEVGSTATTYTRNNGGVFPARFDYDPVTLAPRGILIEEQRTNLMLQSNAFSSAPWGPDTNTIMTANSAVSPDGTTNAWKMAAVNGVISNGQRQFNTKAASAITYTTSLFSKAAGYDWLQIAVFDGTNGNRYWFNVRTGAVGTTSVIGTGFTAVSASVTPAPNGFFRCAIIATSSTATQYDVYLYPAAANGSNGTGNANGDGVFIYGAQLEVGAFATSYIPTVASQVTRSADVCNITAPMFTPWYSQSQGTMVVEFVSNGINTVSSSLAAISDGTGNNILLPFINSGGVSFVSVLSGGATSASLNTGAVTVRAIAKHASAYQADSFAATLNGAAPTVDTAGPVPVGANVMNIGWAAPYGGLYLNGWLRTIRYYPFRASNNQLQALTT